MALTLIYKRKGKKLEATCTGTDDLGAFIYNNQPLEVIAVRFDPRRSFDPEPFNPDNVAGYHPDQSPGERKRRTGQ